MPAAAAVLVAASGTAAAAAIGGWSAPWAQDPDGSIEFTLPSGDECEIRIGDLGSSDEGSADQVRAWLDEHTLDEIVDIEEWIAKERDTRILATLADGRQIEVGYGTDHYDADYEYVTAVTNAISSALTTRAQEVGLSSEGADDGGPWFEMAGEIKCDGTNANPQIASWQR
ncbi:MAG: hypothetical protein Q4G67_02325 [Actinomycetia bacterium]|nr:hypothetical protein [Actinomycetes bacterium]